MIHDVAADDPGEEGGPGGFLDGLGRISKVMGALGQIWGAVGSIEQIIGMFTGAESPTQQIVDAIEELDQTLIKGFETLKNAIFDASVKAQWQPYADRMKADLDKIAGYAAELNTLDANATINIGAERISLVNWCEGTDADPGALQAIGDWVKDYASWISDGTDGAPSPIALWEQVGIAARAAGVPPFTGQQLHETMFAWMQSVALLVQSATYTHNAAFTLYRGTTNPDPKYVNLKDYLGALGSTSTAGSAWASFETMFAKYRGQRIVADEGYCASVSWNDPADITLPVGLGGWDGGFSYAFSNVPCELPDGYMVALRLESFTWDPYYWYLVADFVQLGSRGPSLVHGMQGVYAGGPSDGEQFTGTTPGELSMGYGYCDVPPPPVSDPNVTMVVVGARIDQAEGVLMLSLRYRALRTHPDGTQEFCDDVGSATYHMPSASDLVAIARVGNQISHVHLGQATTPTLLPIVNASFLQTGDGLGITVRTDWTGYRADVYQPAALISQLN